ncbi:hypothetical protein QQF64_029608 [Cirrhinus molitorella]|uniref:Uncharacterized protein n=1 Tax=Cirrhinus molitorella TaxID=172907 RepID=A0ABR3N149_9TELE
MSKVYPLSTGCLSMSVEQQELSHSCQVSRGSCVEIHLVCISFCVLARSEQSACLMHVEAPCAALRMISQNGSQEMSLTAVYSPCCNRNPQMRTNSKSCLRLF